MEEFFRSCAFHLTFMMFQLNLASQSVLEGLNACLDHRAEVSIPELRQTFYVQRGKTRIFACQNPMYEGGGRKGLPQSFLNRFTQVHVYKQHTPIDSHRYTNNILQ